MTLTIAGRRTAQRPESRLGASDTYGYVGPTEMVFETGSSGTRSLLDLDGSRLAVKNGSTVQWVIFDLHGSVAALCTAGGTTITDAYRYDGWGQTIATSGSSTNPWKYRGLLGIDPSGGADKLYDMGARDYAPGTGTFTQLDTVAGGAVNPMTMNRFLYALANPATLIDPDGHMAACPTCDGGGTEVAPESQVSCSGDDACHGGGQTGGGGGAQGDGGTWDGGGSNGGNAGGADPPSSPTPPGYSPAPPGMHWSISPMINGEHMLLPDSCSEAADGFLSGTCHDVEAWNTALTGYAVAGGAVVLCVAVCGAVVTAGGSAATAWSSGFGFGGAATAACVEACWTIPEIVGFGCGVTGTCLGPEIGPSVPRVGTAVAAETYDQMPLFIDTPRGVAVQALTPEALAARDSVLGGSIVYKGGNANSLPPEESQFWALTHPGSPGYGEAYGVPPANLPFDWIASGRIKPGEPFITRPAPGVDGNLGGGIEVVTYPGAYNHE